MPADPALAPVQPAATPVAAFVAPAGHGPVDTPVRVRSAEEYRRTFATDGEPGILDLSVELFFANGGREAVVVRTAGPAAEHVVPTGGAGGLGALTEPFSVLVLPGLTTRHTRAVERALERCAQERAILLLDLPHEADARSAALQVDQVRGARDRAAAYHPWVVVGSGVAPDGTSLPGAAVPPSGAIAGALASTDAARGLGETPTGGNVELRGIDGLVADLSGEEAELMAVHGINALRSMPDRRRVVQGGRLLGASTSTEASSRFLAVRRLTDHVLTSLEQALTFVGDRRTDPGLADLVRRRAEDFLTGLWQRGALAGESPREAFFVRCDATSTSQADLDAGCMGLVLGLATTRPAEFEVHRLELRTSRARGPEVMPAPVALARATARARERRGVVERVHLGPLSSRWVGETERRLESVFERAATTNAVLLLEEADALFGRRTDGRGAARSSQVGQVLQRLSQQTGVPYVLAGRPEGRAPGPAGR